MINFLRSTNISSETPYFGSLVSIFMVISYSRYIVLLNVLFLAILVLGIQIYMIDVGPRVIFVLGPPLLVMKFVSYIVLHGVDCHFN